MSRFLQNYAHFQTVEGGQWSTVDKRCMKHDGCIVDLGCWRWDWSRFFIGKKRVVGADPFEEAREGTEIFKGVIFDREGTMECGGSGGGAALFLKKNSRAVKSTTWKKFCKDYNIDQISVLKMNIEGAEIKILKSFDDEDFSKIDQISVSFHDWMGKPKFGLRSDTLECLEIIRQHDFDITDLDLRYGWRLCVKRR